MVQYFYELWKKNQGGSLKISEQEMMVCVIDQIDDITYSAEFTTPHRAVTPGQAIVMYKGQRMLGGGIII